MKKTKRHEKINPYDPYEDFVKLDKLDAYEAQIKCTSKKNINLLNNMIKIYFSIYQKKPPISIGGFVNLTCKS